MDFDFRPYISFSKLEIRMKKKPSEFRSEFCFSNYNFEIISPHFAC